MPDFWPLIRSSLPALGGVLVFVALVHFVAFVAKRWRSI